MTSSSTTDPTPLAASTGSTGHVHATRCWWDVRQARWSCEGPLTTSPVLSSVPERPLVDVRDMLVVHIALLRELRLAPAAVRRTAAGDRRQASAVAGHLRLVTGLLHHHHEGEDLLLLPRLRERAGRRGAAAIAAGEEQHADLDLELVAVERLRSSWTDDPSATAREALAQHLDHLHALLRDHLDHEERAVLPLAATVLTQAEWDAVGAAGAASVPRRAMPLVLGMFAYEGDPVVVRQMLAAAPPLVRSVLPVAGRRAYAHRASRVHGTPRP